MAFEKLKTCPLIETVCELRFAQSVPWDASVTGLLQEQLKARFPVVERPSGKHVEVMLGKGSPSVHEIESSRTQFFSADKRALIQTDSRMVSANRLAPYEGWEASFLPIIQEMLKAVRAVRPSFELSHVGLRYINGIPLRPDDADLEHYLTILPRLKGRLERPLRGFFHRYELAHDDFGAALVLQAGLRRETGKTVVMLDLDCVSLKAAELKTDDAIRAWLERAHACVIESFNASITADLLERLKKGL